MEYGTLRLFLHGYSWQRVEPSANLHIMQLSNDLMYSLFNYQSYEALWYPFKTHRWSLKWQGCFSPLYFWQLGI